MRGQSASNPTRVRRQSYGTPIRSFLSACPAAAIDLKHSIISFSDSIRCQSPNPLSTWLMPPEPPTSMWTPGIDPTLPVFGSYWHRSSSRRQLWNGGTVTGSRPRTARRQRGAVPELRTLAVGGKQVGPVNTDQQNYRGEMAMQRVVNKQSISQMYHLSAAGPICIPLATVASRASKRLLIIPSMSIILSKLSDTIAAKFLSSGRGSGSAFGVSKTWVA